jgi:hypothetical protein
MGLRKAEGETLETRVMQLEEELKAFATQVHDRALGLESPKKPRGTAHDSDDHYSPMKLPALTSNQLELVRVMGVSPVGLIWARH